MAPFIAVLPQCFPYYIRCPAHRVGTIVNMLINGGTYAINGSSFAVTADAPRGYRNIWLSEVSYQTLKEAHIVPLVYQATKTKPES